MSAATTADAAGVPEAPRRADPLPRSAAGLGGPWVMTTIVSIATFMEILDTSIANVALDTISGNLGVAVDQGTWTVTSYLVANAIIIPISGFLSAVLGRKRYFLISIVLFTVSSFACAFAPSLGALVLARVFQGIGGGGLAPVEQSMIADSFPPAKRGQAFAAFGMVVIVAPIIGPTIGGAITDSISWHWIFLINIPVGILAFFATLVAVREPELLQRERAELFARGIRIDWVGFLLLAVGLGSLLIMLDRGQTENWFSSDLIVTTAIMAFLGLGGMVVWELNHDDPIVPLRMLAYRNFAICALLMLLLGLLVFGTIQLVPQMLQGVFGYDAYDAGLALTYGGWSAAIMMPLSGFVTGRVDTRVLLVPAFGLAGLSFYLLSVFSTQSTFADAAMARFVLSCGLPFLFIPISTVAYLGIPPGYASRASAMLNFFRNLGGAFGISLCQTLLAQREQFHQSRLVEGLSGLNPTFSGALHSLTAQVGSQTEAMALLYQQVQTQAAMLSYNETFRLLAWMIVAVIPLVLVLKVRSDGAGG
ncbi:EmrB/QacA family drug resistance transporter [Acuticoccus sediminis]|uniref:EmrB/QacA family drug resistance transporter n=1 Tax=Acuticoccus sediminis TaxID=2184697 RepID=A0A8B2NQL0_9HYPH|nr:DHA2 family efflux MFS transporter permease subunit [Acuticoccus sediminis]RAH99293.1 EmrB/QacA family drug resistance transporter [Acuticoccus sediminis]